MEKYVVTISRQFASMGRSIAQQMATDLNIEFYDRDIVEATAKRMGQPIPIISEEEERSTSKYFKRAFPLGVNMQDEIFEVQKNIIEDISKKESCIIVGRCGNSILRNTKNSLHIFVFAPYETRIENCIEYLEMSRPQARQMINKVDKAREIYRKRYSSDLSPLDGYDLLIDSSKLGIDKTASALCSTVKDIFH